MYSQSLRIRGFLFNLLLIALFLNISSCNKGENPAPGLSIISFSPTTAGSGELVTITGTGFSGTTVNDIVKFNGSTAQVSAATSTSITAIVPVCYSGKISVSVNGITKTSATDFILIPITITDFAPTSGAAGASITITGTAFSETIGHNQVKFNGTIGTITAATKTSLTVTVPDNVTTGKLTVSSNGVSVKSANDFVVDPTITKILSYNANAGVAGDFVDIYGNNFGATEANTVVRFNGVVAPYYAHNATPTRLMVFVPEQATTGKISIQVDGGTVVYSANNYTILTPTITSFSPKIGGAGTLIEIDGTNFSSNSSYNIVKFNGVQGEVYSSHSDAIWVKVPGSATTGKISVTVGLKTVTSVDDFQPCYGTPELIIGSIEVSNISSDRTSFYVYSHLNNYGDTQADLTNEVVHAYVSTDAADNGNDIEVGAWALPSTVNPNDYVFVNHTATIPGGATVDSHPYLILKISGTVAECNTTNNTVIKQIK